MNWKDIVFQWGKIEECSIGKAAQMAKFELPEISENSEQEG